MEVFQVHPLAFPCAVTDIVEGETLHLAIDGGYEGPPDGIGAKAAMNKVFQRHGDLFGCAFVLGKLADKLQ